MDRTIVSAVLPCTLGLVVAAVFASLLTACARAAPTLPVPVTSQWDPLNATRWQLVAVVSGGLAHDVPTGPVLFAQFDDGVVQVRGSCNGIMSYYQIRQGSISTTLTFPTAQDCTSSMPEVTAVEAVTFEALKALDSYTVDGARLFVRSPEATLVLHRADGSPAPSPSATAASLQPSLVATALACPQPTPGAICVDPCPGGPSPTPDVPYAHALAQALASAFAAEA